MRGSTEVLTYRKVQPNIPYNHDNNNNDNACVAYIGNNRIINISPNSLLVPHHVCFWVLKSTLVPGPLKSWILMIKGPFGRKKKTWIQKQDHPQYYYNTLQQTLHDKNFHMEPVVDDDSEEGPKFFFINTTSLEVEGTTNDMLTYTETRRGYVLCCYCMCQM